MASEHAEPRPHLLHRITTDYGQLAVHEHPAAGAPIVFLHGFPDDSRIYDKLIPLLPGRRLVAIDFIGYGQSERTSASLVQAGQRVAEVGAVLQAMDLHGATIVGHDSGGPVAIDTAVQSQRVEHLVLLNSYYGRETQLRLPEMIQLFGDPRMAPLADAILDDPPRLGWLLGHTARQFGYDPQAEDSVRLRAIIPQFFGDDLQPHARQAVRAWTRALPRDLSDQTRRAKSGGLRGFVGTVTLAFGAEDNYLSPRLAEQMASRFTDATTRIIPEASHWPQWDQPERVAEILRSTT